MRTELHAVLLRVRHALYLRILFASNDPKEAFALAEGLSCKEPLCPMAPYTTSITTTTATPSFG
jgi:hypothetical protein